MDPRRFDQLARTCAAPASRRTVIRWIAAFVAGGSFAVAAPSAAWANHRAGHCTKPGKKCHKHKDCCDGLCGSDGTCVARAEVDAWVRTTLTRIDAFQALATSAVDTIASMAEFGFSARLLDEIGTTAGAIGEIRTHLQTDVSPLVATDPLRALLDAIAAAIDALSAYLEQVSEENFLETGHQATDAIFKTLSDLPSIRAQISALCDECDD
jgi:hypothetical protein